MPELSHLRCSLCHQFSPSACLEHETPPGWLNFGTVFPHSPSQQHLLVCSQECIVQLATKKLLTQIPE